MEKFNNTFDQSFNTPHSSIADLNKANSDARDAASGEDLTRRTESCTATPKRIKLKRILDDRREELEIQIAIHGEHLLPD